MRGIILGLLGAVVICAFSFFNDHVIKQGMLIPHQLPSVVYGGLVVLALIAGVALRRIRWVRVFSASDWAVAVGLWLVACGLPGWGLVECLPPTAIMTHRYVQTEPGWRTEQVNILEMVPERMLVDIESDEQTLLAGYVSGLGPGTRHISVSAVPWGAWAGAMAFWLPFVLAFTAAMYGLAAVVHRQWSHHEKLPYPISSFAHALLPDEDGTVSILCDRLFWIGAGAAFFLYINNYLARWFPEALISIPLSVDLRPFYDIFPFLNGHGFRYSLSLTVLGLAYFLRSNVSLSVGIMPYLWTALAAALAFYGMPLSGGTDAGANYNSLTFAGGYMGVFLLLVYAGRHYYANALRGAVFLPTRGAADAQAVWGMRVFLAGMLVALAVLVSVGLEWHMALMFALLATVTMVAVSRAVAETGAFYFGTYFLPGAVIMTFAGAAAVGPQAAMILSLAGSSLLLAPGWAPMPFVVQALRLSDLGKANVHRSAKWGVAALFICVPIALGCTLYWSYDQGAPVNNYSHIGSRISGQQVVRMAYTLASQGRLEEATSFSGWERLLHISPSWPHVGAFAFTAGLAILCGWCSLRFTKWPFHPVMFLFLGSYHGQCLSVSLLFGCGLKVAVARYGGGSLYNRLKPLMIGLIAGSVLAQIIPMVVGLIYYLLTSSIPPGGMRLI